MQFRFAFLATTLLFSTLVSAGTILEIRQDGQSGDGGCNPCDEYVNLIALLFRPLIPSSRTCDIFSKREDVFIPRMLEANETDADWLPDETMRWSKVAVGDVGRLNSRATHKLTFDCSKIPEICVSC